MPVEAYELHTKGPCQRDRLVNEGVPEDPSYFGLRVLHVRTSTPAVALSAVTTYP